MSKLDILKQISTKPDLAELLGVDAAFLTRTLYIVRPEKQYHQFTIKKKSGGIRIINAPSDELKSLQKRLSILLLDCIDEINSKKFPTSQSTKPKLRKNNENDYAAEVLKVKIPTSESKQPSLSHGFARDRSIITNAMMHIGKKNILNIDLENFFDSFNFGRIRGFFIKNENFKLNEHIATVIAQIACHENALPQGSPCSPVLSNLITHSLDIKLASLSKKYKCTYTRYADDITFSTRSSKLPSQLIIMGGNNYILGNRLLQAIKSSGFSINDSKTRVQLKDSRHDVTGLVANRKPNTRKEYWRLARAKCNTLFKTGSFTSVKDNVEVAGNLNELEGQLNFIDHIDHYNRLRQKSPLVPEYALKDIGKNTKTLLSGREKTFSQFLYYRLFCGNEKPTILCEGKTDNIYLKSAISQLKIDYPLLVDTKGEHYDLLVRFVEYTKRTRFLLGLHGGTDYLKGFIESFEKNMKLYENVKPKNPVIIFLDNDTGPNNIVCLLQSKNFKDKINLFPSSLDKSNEIRKSEFIHVIKNLYVIFTPRGIKDEDTDIEHFFDRKTRMMKHVNGKCFNTIEKRDTKSDLSKDAFATYIIKERKKEIDFRSLKPLLDPIVKVIRHYESL